ncbi:late embryogenesis abundant protein 2 [Fibrella aestuarina BUZ 2]|uniref:Late embryogenesis abundant protein 2 n=1 Tax=Fibrella aestuarina BUZ 2 TaxID=1166018 RepID=I0K5I0_9BACT|nr:LEA type 2 family protein [Fibrella aestuarina]CCG99383.1 late embryogenesis abundant protein 2 [Fibrella aestuarina BUZ 2]
MKKGLLITLGILLLLGIGGYIYYTNLKQKARSEDGAYDGTLKPRLELSRFDFTDISDDAIQMNMYLLIDNPLPVGFKARRVDYSFFIDNEEVVKDSYDKVVEVKSQDSTLIALPAKLLAAKMTRVLKRLEAQGVDSTDYRLRTTFDLDVPIAGERTFTVSQSLRGPTYYIPKIEVKDIDLGKFGLKKTDVAATISCTNKNKFPYNITDARYTVTINGKEIAQGVQAEPILIKAQGTTPFVLPVTVKPGQTLGLLPKMLFDKKDTPVEIAFSCKILDKNNDPMFKNSQFVTTIRGTLAELMKKQ